MRWPCASAGVIGSLEEGLWEGGGSLVAAGDSVIPWGGDAACHDGNCTMLSFERFWTNMVGNGRPLMP